MRYTKIVKNSLKLHAAVFFIQKPLYALFYFNDFDLLKVYYARKYVSNADNNYIRIHWTIALKSRYDI